MVQEESKSQVDMNAFGLTAEEFAEQKKNLEKMELDNAVKKR
jgi:hypothetical protein